MAAVLSSTGTWTRAGTVDLTAMAKTQPNLPVVEDWMMELLKDANGRGLVYPEIQQMVQLMADGLNIGHWPAAALMRYMLNAYLSNQFVPDVGSRVSP